MAWTAPAFDGSGSLRGAAEESRWAAAARLAGERHGLACDAPRMFATGSDVVMDCGGWVFKMTAPRWAGEIEAEHALLERVAGALPVDTPEALGRGEIDGWPYCLMSRLDGRALADVWGELAGDERARLARSMGEICAELHRLEVRAEEEPRWTDFLGRMRAGARERQAKQEVSQDWLERIEPFLDSLGPLSRRGLRLLHTELYDQHLLVTERAGRWELSGVIDFADGRVGDPWYEMPALVEFIFQGERPLLGELLRAYGLPEDSLDESLSRELCGWGLLHQFGSLPRMLKAAGAPEPKGFDELAARLYGFD